MLLSAYEQGIFPWYNPEDPILWQSPDPRFIIFPENLHVSKSMKKVLGKGLFKISFDNDFEGVIENCASCPRPGKNGDEPAGTWITSDIIAAYTELHHLGWAHSAEAYLDGKLVGGCYGLRLGSAFFGESMFARADNASKAAFLTLADHLFNDDVVFIDCQVHTDHLESLGGQKISRSDFLALLKKTLAPRSEEHNCDTLDRRGKWQNYASHKKAIYPL
jgi:leucyl/phenylalanyl-tRNA--protein transferase